MKEEEKRWPQYTSGVDSVVINYSQRCLVDVGGSEPFITIQDEVHHALRLAQLHTATLATDK